MALEKDVYNILFQFDFSPYCILSKKNLNMNMTLLLAISGYL